MISNVKVFGIEDSFKASKYPMAVDISKLDCKPTNTIKKLASCKMGTGHDNWLNGCIVQFDLSFTIKAWTEAERYHFFDFVSSQSTIHRITKFDLDDAYIEYVDKRIIAIMKGKIHEYNKLALNIEYTSSVNSDTYNIETNAQYTELLKNKYLEILYSNPCGFKLTARMTTNYRQLKTIYWQRKNHKLPEWREFCKWCETLPYFKEYVLNKDDK